MFTTGIATPIPQQAFRVIIGSTDPEDTTHFVYEPWYAENIGEVAEKAAISDTITIKLGHQQPAKENAWSLIEVVKIPDPLRP